MSILAGHRLAVLDVETTGWRPRHGDTLLEVARVDLEDGAIIGSWATLVGPRRPIPPEAVEIHGITEEMLAESADPAQVARAICANCSGLPLVFHNAAFDLSFLGALLRAAGLRRLDGPVIDTLGLARGLFGSGGNTLGELLARLELPPERLHRALGDARATAHVLLALAPRWESERGIRTLDELAAASQDANREAARKAAAQRRAAEAEAAEAARRAGSGGEAIPSAEPAEHGDASIAGEGEGAGSESDDLFTNRDDRSRSDDLFPEPTELDAAARRLF